MSNVRDPAALPRVAACVCTHRRNEQLRRILERFVEIDAQGEGRYALGVVVVDDNPGGDAEPVVAEFASAYALGVHYRRSGHENISLARNVALSAGIEIGDVIVMTDDDCLPEVTWVDALLATQRATGAGTVSGPHLAMLPADAPRWIVEQEVFEHEHEVLADQAPMRIGQTNNCLLDVGWLRDHPDHRFDPEFGRTGGEDMVFFRGAIDLGLRSVHSAAARVHHLEPLEDLTFRVILRSRYWWGTSEATTNLVATDASRLRLALRGVRRTMKAVARPVARLLRVRPPHVRSAALDAANGVGLVVGALGHRVNHH